MFVFAHMFSHTFLGQTHIQNTYKRSIEDEKAADGGNDEAAGGEFANCSEDIAHNEFPF